MEDSKQGVNGLANTEVRRHWLVNCIGANVQTIASPKEVPRAHVVLRGTNLVWLALLPFLVCVCVARAVDEYLYIVQVARKEGMRCEIKGFGEHVPCRFAAKSTSIHSKRAWFQLEITVTLADSVYRLREQVAIDLTSRRRKTGQRALFEAIRKSIVRRRALRGSDRFVANVLLEALLATGQKKERNRDDTGRDACYE